MKYLSELVGFILFISFIWARFLYKRLPRDIPFDLSLFGVIILVIICIFYIYKVYKIIKPSISSNFKILLYPIATLLLKPLLHFNQFLLSKKMIRSIMKVFLTLLYKLFKIHIVVGYHSVYIHAFLTVIPQIIITICLIIDCFYFKQLNLMYSCVIIIVFPLIVRYLLFIFETIMRYDTELLDEYFIIEITSEDIVYPKSDYDEEGFFIADKPTYSTDPSRLSYDDYESFDSMGNLEKYKYLKTFKFIDNQTSAIICGDLLYEYKILVQNERKDVFFMETITLPEDLNKDICNNLLQFHMNISVLKDKINFAKESLANKYTHLHIFLYIITLVCWVYIIIISLHTFHLSDMEIRILQSFLDNIEPFSDVYLKRSQEL